MCMAQTDHNPQVSGLFLEERQGGPVPAPPAHSHARRSRPPERLSPDVSPRVQRRLRSPSKSTSRDPPAPTLKRCSAKAVVRPKRNPLPQHDPQDGASMSSFTANPPAVDRDLLTAPTGSFSGT